MSPKVAIAVILLALGLAAGAWVLWAPSPVEAPTAEDPTEPAEAAVEDEEQVLSPASLYFPGDDGWLHGVEINVPADDRDARVRALVDALIAGPRDASDGFLSAPMPEGAQLDALYFLGPGTVALDFRLATSEAPAEEAPTPDPSIEEPAAPGEDAVAPEPTEALLQSRMARMGSKQELLTVYSVVNTVVLGSEEVERVVLMVDGKQPETLAGHVDLTRPLRPDPSWARTQAP
ncbi:MAG: GerMN domain-containing protein [Acidobacteriota bacterium]